jgi:hypothetical protein
LRKNEISRIFVFKKKLAKRYYTQEDSVGGTGHSGPAEDDDNERVGDEGDENEDGHNDAVDGLDELQRSQPVARVQVVARPLLVASGETRRLQ